MFYVAEQIPFDRMYDSPIDDTMEYFADCIICGNRQATSYNTDIFRESENETMQEIYRSAHYYRPEEIAAELTQETGNKYTYRTIRGSCQSDWNYLFYPQESTTKETINVIETEYFNTGTEWMVTETETGETYNIYIHNYNPDNIQISKYIGCSTQELKVKRFVSYKQIAIYDC